MSPRPKLADLVAPELRPFLTYSFGLHLALTLLGAKLLGLAGTAGKSTVYTIDFVGGPGQIISNTGEGAAAAPPGRTL